MKRMTCELCGSNDFVKEDGLFVCQSCGTKYSLEEARKMMIEGTVEVVGTVKVDNSAQIENYLSMAENAVQASNEAEAESYANKIIEIDPKNVKAWEIKGKVAGWQSTGRNNRLGETVTAWLNAIEYADEAERPALRDRIGEEFARLVMAMVSLHGGHFAKLQTEENTNELIKCADSAATLMNRLTIQGKVAFNRGYIYNEMGRMIFNNAKEGYQAAKKEFGPEHRNMSKYSWDKYWQNGGRCTKLMEKSLQFVRDISLANSIITTMVQIGTEVRDSSSWKYDSNSWNADHYVQEYSFTKEAKESRTKTINGWNEKKKNYAATKAANVLQRIGGSRVAQEEKAAWDQYWAEHAEERQALENDRNAAIAAYNEATQKLNSPLPEDAEIQKINSQINAMRTEMQGLGLFKGKQKKELQERIDSFTGQLGQMQSRARQARQPFESAVAAAQQKIAGIDAELGKSRGRIDVDNSIEPIEGAMADGKIQATPRQLFDRLQALLPAPYTFKPLEVYDGDSGAIKGFGGGIPELGKGLVAFLINPTISGDNKNTGVVLHMYADAEDQPCRAIDVQTMMVGGSSSVAMKEEEAYLMTLVGSLVMQLLTKEATQTLAEQYCCQMLLENKPTRGNVGDLMIEFYHYNKTVVFSDVGYSFILMYTVK